MTSNHTPLSSVALQAGTLCTQPSTSPELAHDADPAVDVMTDFVMVAPITVNPEMPIGEALDKMRIDGVRLLLVTDNKTTVIGLITARDIQGEKPIKLIQSSGMPHSEITVKMIMTPQDAITVLNMISVRNAEVGHIVKTLHDQQRQHALVVEIDEQSGKQTIRGMFSSTHISRLLGYDVSEDAHAAQTLADIQHELT